MSIRSYSPSFDVNGSHGPGPRIALYSHDTCGLGHLRRNLVISRTLRSRLSASILLVSGIREAGSFPIDNGIDTLLLPALAKIDNRYYRSRRLELSLDALIHLRSGALKAALTAFEPDVFIVDNVPRGAVRELDDTLALLRAMRTTYCVLGLRDVLDARENVKKEWLSPTNVTAIEDFYDTVWIYGDSSVYDAPAEYDFPDHIRRKVRFTGYINPLTSLPRSGEQSSFPEAPDLCLVGGGQDGIELASTFAEACRITGRHGVVLTGPFMDDSTASVLAAHPFVTVHRFSPDPIPLYTAARSVVSMGGYNTVLELLALGKRPLIVPRISPREEQLLRAEALRRRDLVDVLHPSRLSPSSIAEWLNREQRSETLSRNSNSINMNGLETIVDDLKRLVLRSRVAASA